MINKGERTMRKMITTVLCLVVSLSVFSGCYLITKAEPNYEEIYGKVTKNTKTVFKYAKYSDYLIHFFGKDKINFNKHFYYDLDKNGIKELFVYDSKLGLVEVFTIKNNKLKSLGYEFYYGINKKRKALIVKGHWHGAGGSSKKEYWVYKLNKKKTKLKLIWYFDKMPCGYTFMKGNKYKDCLKGKKYKKKYKKLYKKYVKGTSRVFK